jgi:hypothetical protein
VCLAPVKHSLKKPINSKCYYTTISKFNNEKPAKRLDAEHIKQKGSANPAAAPSIFFFDFSNARSDPNNLNAIGDPNAPSRNPTNQTNQTNETFFLLSALIL